MDRDEIEKRFSYHQPLGEKVSLMGEIRNRARSLALLVNASMPDCSEKSQAMTDLDDMVMHANAGISRNPLVE